MWASEDGGPARTQVAPGAGLAIAPGERLEVAAIRDAVATTMLVGGPGGELYALRHSLGRRPLRDPAHAWVERLDPLTLATTARSPDLPPGPFWPGGLATAPDGALHVVFGNHAHRLSAQLDVLATRRLPADRPYNSFVTLHDGRLATKDFDHDLRAPARLLLLDPETLATTAEADLSEPCIARLSADATHLYVVGARTVMRLRHDGDDAAGGTLTRDPAWGGSYLRPGASHGWDPVIAAGHVWFLDGGDHDFVTTMRGAARSTAPTRLHRRSLSDPDDHEAVEVSGRPRGAVTNPPLVDALRRIAVAHDAANGVVTAFRLDEDGDDTRLTPLWRRDLAHAAHAVLFPDTGELVLHDFHGPAVNRTAVARALGRRTTFVMHRPALRRAAARGSRDEVVVLDIETGEERARAVVPSLVQSVVFPAPGAARDLYWVTMTTIARLAVRPGTPNPG